MAIVNCYECGNNVSTKASVCPHCGCPRPSGNPDDDIKSVPSETDEENKRINIRLKKLLFWFVVIFLAAAVLSGIIS